MPKFIEWPLSTHPYFCWDGRIHFALGVIPTDDGTWIMAKRPEDNAIEPLQISDVFDQCIFYESSEKAGVELEAKQS